MKGLRFYFLDLLQILKLYDRFINIMLDARSLVHVLLSRFFIRLLIITQIAQYHIVIMFMQIFMSF